MSTGPPSATINLILPQSGAVECRVGNALWSTSSYITAVVGQPIELRLVQVQQQQPQPAPPQQVLVRNMHEVTHHHVVHCPPQLPLQQLQQQVTMPPRVFVNYPDSVKLSLVSSSSLSGMTTPPHACYDQSCCSPTSVLGSANVTTTYTQAAQQPCLTATTCATPTPLTTCTATPYAQPGVGQQQAYYCAPNLTQQQPPQPCVTPVMTTTTTTGGGSGPCGPDAQQQGQQQQHQGTCQQNEQYHHHPHLHHLGQKLQAIPDSLSGVFFKSML